MKPKTILPLIFAGLLLNTTAFAQDYPSSRSTSKKTLIWQDEFKGKGLPDPEKWGYEEGFIRNRESQYYTKARLENCFMKGGKLIIRSLKESYQNASYTSASINTLGKQQFEGDFRIEIRAKLPQGQGIWPALWMMGTNIQQVGWPKCFEFDIMEFVGHTPNTVHGTFHWWEPEGKDKHRSKGSTIKESDLHNKFHVYGIERKGDTAKVFIDDKVYFTMAAPPNAYQGSFRGPVYLLMNTAIGGEWGGKIDDAIFPQEFVIDYVRAYKLD